MPDAFGPAENPPAVDMTRLVGTYRREGVVTTVTRGDDGAHIRYEFVDGMKDFSPPLEMDLVPVSETVFAASGGPSFGGERIPVVFSTLADGTECVYIGMRVTPKVA